VNPSPDSTCRPLAFSGDLVEAYLVTGAKEYEVAEEAIVVNLGTSDVVVTQPPDKPLRAMSSAILRGTRVEPADGLVVLRVTDAGRANIAALAAAPGWRLLGEILAGAPGDTGGRPFPPETPLWRSEQDTAGRVRFDPGLLLEGPGAARGPREFTVRLNLWFAPAGTDCFIHRRHAFIELHTQVHGIGAMQKFTAQDHATRYQDVPMSPGVTAPADMFCSLGPDGEFVYPWHQYRAVTDCVWLAVEYHPVPGSPAP